MGKKRIGLDYYPYSSIEIFWNDDEDRVDYPFSLYLGAARQADSRMTRAQIIQLRDSINELLAEE